MTTSPGFSSRSTVSTFRQFPQKDAAMADTNGMENAGWSNSPAADHAPDDVHPEVAPPEELIPGFSNGKAVADAESKVVADGSAEDKAVAKKATSRKKG